MTSSLEMDTRKTKKTRESMIRVVVGILNETTPLSQGLPGEQSNGRCPGGRVKLGIKTRQKRTE